MKAKDKVTGKIIDVTPAFGGYFSCNGELIPQGDLEFNFDPSQSEATICGWVARDQPINHVDKGNLTLFAEKPKRGYYDYNDLVYGFWSDNEKPTIPLSADLFPSLTWQDEPIEVEITIKPKKQ